MSIATDGMVEHADLLTAIEEIRHGDGPAILERLHTIEPALALYIEGVSTACTALWLRGSPIGMDRTLQAVLIVVRARELANVRLFRKLIPPSSPAGRVLKSVSENGQENGSKK